MTEGISTLFLMTSNAVEDRVADAMKQFKFEIIGTNLPKEEEKNCMRPSLKKKQQPQHAKN